MTLFDIFDIWFEIFTLFMIKLSSILKYIISSARVIGLSPKKKTKLFDNKKQIRYFITQLE
jgi:hypothetical protein